jgi:aminopeptidase N
MRTDTAQPVRLSDYRAPDYLIDTVDLDIGLHLTETQVRARLSVRPNPQGRPGAPLVLDGDGLTATTILLDGVAVALSPDLVSPDRLTITQPPARPFELIVDTRVDPSANTQLMGLYRSGSAYCTQCEAEGFRRITYFLDRPDVLSVYTTRIEAEKAEAPVLLGNGNLVESGDIPGSSRHFAIWHDPHPKPCYLFALVGGDLGSIHDTFMTMSGREVKLGIYVEHGKESRAAYAMDALKRSMAWDEEAFGLEYDLDVFNIVAVSDFNMGAMENKGLNVFNDKYVLALPQTATDLDYAHIEGVIAHEYFHNWTGNRITCRDWFQLCLKEGLTVFRDQEFSSDQRSRTVKRISDVRALRAAQFPEDGGPLAHNVRPETYLEINNFYTPTIYEKGAEVIRMLKALIGAESFRSGMDLYFERCDGMAATVEDFIACFAEAAGRDLTQFMRWYSQAGTPLLTVNSAYDAEARTFTLTLAQSTAPTPGQPEKKPLVLPVALGLVGSGGDLPLTTKAPGEDGGASLHECASGIFELGDSSRQIVFHNVAERPVPSVLRGFSAPVKLELDTSTEDLLTLAARDSDLFNRWQAIQTHATRLLTTSVATIRAGGLPVLDERFPKALGSVLDLFASDPAFTAQAISLPAESDIAREIGKDVDPDAIHMARRELRRSIGAQLQPRLLKVYEALSTDAPYAPDARSAGARALRNAALDLLATGDAQTGADIAMRQFQSAHNMTDQFGALAVLSVLPGDQREQALDSFYRSHASDPLVIDKWFSTQALSTRPDTLNAVEELLRHPDFAYTNPNRFRALVGAFTVNQRAFHEGKGRGYAFLADQILALDPVNPQTAAKMVPPLGRWRRFDDGRASLMRAALERIVAQPGVSKDVYEQASKSLV